MISLRFDLDQPRQFSHVTSRRGAARPEYSNFPEYSSRKRVKEYMYVYVTTRGAVTDRDWHFLHCSYVVH